MNTFSRFGSRLFRGSRNTNTNSYTYINKQNINVSFDPSGTDYIDYSNNAYFTDSHNINPNDENTTSLILNNSDSNYLNLSSLDEFTIYMKYQVYNSSNIPIFGQIYNNPNYDISFSNNSPSVGDSFQVYVLNGSGTTLTYSITGDFTSANLNGASLTGSLPYIENILDYTISSGGGVFKLLINNVDISNSFEVELPDIYYVKVNTNIVNEKVWAISRYFQNGIYYNQPDFSFSAPNVYDFDVSDPSNNGYVLSFSTTVDVSDATIESTYVTRTNPPGTTGAKVLLDLRNYSGASLVYFEDSSANMGYVEHDVDTAVTYSDPSNPYNPNKNSRTFYGTQSNGKTGWEEACQLDTTGDYLAWRPEVYSNGTFFVGAYMQINLSASTEIAGVITQGRVGYSEWCTSYRFTYSTDNTTFYDIDGRTSWEGNTDNSTWHYNYFSSTLTARYVRIYPLTYQGTPAMTAGLFLGQIGDITNDYAVTVSNEVFYIDGSANPQIDFSANNLYVFDQSDPTNDGQQIVFGFTFDDSANILTSADGVTIMGTPGRPGAYTQIDLSSGFVGPLYYYSVGSANMGWQLVADISHQFTVKTNIYDEPVWALYDETNSAWYNQPDLSFSAPYVYEFDVSDPSNNDYVLSFGTIVDVSDATIESTYVTRTNTPGMAYAKVLLDLRYYSGASLVYFENTSAGMGYDKASLVTAQSTMEVLVVGGGGQGSSNYSAGGGAGGMLTPSFSFTPSGYNVDIEVGAGGNGWTSANPVPTGPNGGNSSYGSYIAYGGGGGGGQNPSSTATIAGSGGSGGGGGCENSSSGGNITFSYGGSGTSGQGNDGGNGTYTFSSKIVYWASGGGGGAGGAGGNASLGYGGDGGDAKQWHVNLQYYAAGGGGATRASATDQTPADQKGGEGGYGGGVMLGGHGSPSTAGGNAYTGTGGMPNTGSGGGGGFATDAVTGVQQGGADGVVNVWVPFSYTFSSSHVSNVTNNIGGSSSALTYNGTAGTLVSFIGAGTATWTPGWVETVYISVTVSNEVFYIDGSANPQIEFLANESYVFDQSDPTNAGQQIVFGYIRDNSSNIFTSADGVTIMGTPGQPGAYTYLDLSAGFTGTLYYYSNGSANMGHIPPNSTNFSVASELNAWATRNSNLAYTSLSDSYTLTGSTNTFANGTYVLTVSDLNTVFTQSNGNYINQVFNDDYNSGHPGYDWPAGAAYYTNGVATSSHPTSITATNNNTYYGSSIQLSMPYSLLLKQISARSQSDNSKNPPKDVVLLGSNDNGQTFDLIVDTTFPFQVQTAITTITPTITNTTAYNMIRMVISNFQGTGGTAILEYFDLIGDVY